ncbi:MAG: ribosome maturation factor RimM [Clostridiales bacterium]|nr:ribosome maturation factor RimM [Clostridiales bacterium]MDD7035434.1 ribosome maturation factor RimM [Bacillota bacterium]MDY2919990.1 ribosome maturation factor RimM [Lentihominibacter sp.]
MERILVGKTVAPVGIKGEIKVYNYSDGTDIYEAADFIMLDEDSFRVERVRLQKNMPVLKLEGVNDRDGAERLRGRDVFVSEEYLPELPEGEHYVRDLIGMKVIREDGSEVGILKNVIQNTAQDVYDVETGEGKQVLIPGVPEFLIAIDEEAKTITVRLIEGMLNGEDAVEA